MKQKIKLKKILSLKELSILSKKLKKKKKKIILCHGVFDLLHIGHIKHFQKAKSNGDILIVTLTDSKFVKKGPNRPYFNNSLRAEALAAIEVIDYISVINESTAINVIKKLKPDIYFKGDEYKSNNQDITGVIKKEKNEVKRYGGKIKYTEELTFSSSKILNEFNEDFSSHQDPIIKKLKKDFNFSKIRKMIDNFLDLKVLIIGETIIDEYVFCEALGKSGKEPVLVFKDHGREKYLGGVLAIARHLSSFCKNLSLLSLLGKNNEEKNFIQKNLEKNIKINFFNKKNAPTIIKKRYIDRIDNRKVFGIYSLNDSLVTKTEENKILNFLKKVKNKYDLIIVADYGHGMISSKIAKYISNNKTFFSLNAQINSTNIGLHSINKYKKINSLVINANELRHEMNEREGDIINLAIRYKKLINCNYLSVTQGKKGAFVIDKNQNVTHCPAFLKKVKDKVGAGDAFCAAFIFGLHENWDIEVILKKSHSAGSAMMKIESSSGNLPNIKKL